MPNASLCLLHVQYIKTENRKPSKRLTIPLLNLHFCKEALFHTEADGVKTQFNRGPLSHLGGHRDCVGELCEYLFAEKKSYSRGFFILSAVKARKALFKNTR